jgi:hypothetical protein
MFDDGLTASLICTDRIVGSDVLKGVVVVIVDCGQTAEKRVNHAVFALLL